MITNEKAPCLSRRQRTEKRLTYKISTYSVARFLGNYKEENEK